eukprot:scaffold152046_cov55-Attheya_sp.AAC.6
MNTTYELHNSKEMVLVAVGTNGYVIMDASDVLKGDRDIVTLATSNILPPCDETCVWRVAW